MAINRTTVGVLGVGHLMQYVVPGLLRAQCPPRLLLSARNAVRAKQLSVNHKLEIVSDNRSLVERSDIVAIAVRPFDVLNTIADLPWRPGHVVLSFAATVSRGEIDPLVNGAAVVLALPVVAAQFGESPTVMYPSDSQVEDLMAPCGPVIPLETEQQFEAASALGAYFGWVQMIIGEAASWLEEQGLGSQQARLLAAAMTRAGATTAQMRTETGMAELVDELCLPGSLTGDGVSMLAERNAIAPWQQALDHTLRRIRKG